MNVLYERKMMNRPLISAISFVLFSTASFAAPPEAPALTAKVDGLNVNLSWTEVEGATGYALYYAPSPFLGADSVERFEKGNSLTNQSTLFLGDSYFVAIKAYNENKEESQYSNVELVNIDHLNTISRGPTISIHFLNENVGIVSSREFREFHIVEIDGFTVDGNYHGGIISDMFDFNFDVHIIGVKVTTDPLHTVF